MNLELNKLTGQNFQSFKDLNFDFASIKGLTTLILGENRDDEFASSNGAGKSVVLEAVSWVLFGTTFRSLRYADEVINLQENGCSVELEFFLNEKKYTITRSKTRNKSAVLKLFEGAIELLRDSDTRSKQTQLESIIGFNFSTFTNSIMFHLDYVAFPELKPAERAEILTEVSNLEIYVKAAAQAKQDSLQINSSFSKIEIQINTIERFVDQLQQENYDAKIRNWDDEQIVEIRNLRREIIALKSEEKDQRKLITNNITVAQNKVAEINADIIVQNGYVKVLTENLEPEIEKTEERVIQLAREEERESSEIYSLKNEVKKYQKEIVEMGNLKGGKCPTCQQNITEEHVDACTILVQKKIADTTTQITEKNAVYDRLRASAITLKDELSKYKTRRTKANAYKESLVKLNKELGKENANLKVFQNQLANIEQNQAKLIKLKEDSLDAVRARTNPYIEMKTTQDRQISEKNQEITNLKNEITKLIDDQSYINFYIEGFKKIKLMLFDDLINRLNELTQEFLSRYTSETMVKISCERQTKTGTKDEVYIEVIKNEGEISYAAYSGGERQKIKLSVSLALAQLIEEMCDRNCDIIFFDEPNASLDDVGKQSNFEVFSEIAADGKTVVVIDHDSQFQDKFDNVLTVVKEKGYSRLELN